MCPREPGESVTLPMRGQQIRSLSFGCSTAPQGKRKAPDKRDDPVLDGQQRLHTVPKLCSALHAHLHIYEIFIFKVSNENNYFYLKMFTLN